MTCWVHTTAVEAVGLRKKQESTNSFTEDVLKVALVVQQVCAMKS